MNKLENMTVVKKMNNAIYRFEAFYAAQQFYIKVPLFLALATIGLIVAGSIYNAGREFGKYFYNHILSNF